MTDEIEKNLALITDKCEKLQVACNDHFAIKHLKSNTLKIKAFMKEEEELTDTKDKTDGAIPEGEVQAAEVVIPKRPLESVLTTANKKFKYESPLDFLKINQKTSDDIDDGSGDKYEIN